MEAGVPNTKLVPDTINERGICDLWLADLKSIQPSDAGADTL
jgi:hypothetical protein